MCSSESRLALAALLFGACCSTPPEPVAWDWRFPAADQGDSTFAPAPDILAGIADPSSSDLSVGDAALFGVRTCSGTVQEVRYVFVQVQDPEASEGKEVEFAVVVYDDHQRRIASSRMRAHRPSLLSSVAASCERPQGGDHSGIFAIAEIVRLVEDTPILAEMLWQVIERPGWLTLLTSGANVSFGASFEHARPGAAAFAGRAMYCAPMVVRIAEAPCLECEVHAVPNMSPMNLCGGIVQLLGRAPHDPGRTVLVRLLAAQRGVRAVEAGKG